MVEVAGRHREAEGVAFLVAAVGLVQHVQCRLEIDARPGESQRVDARAGRLNLRNAGGNTVIRFISEARQPVAQ